MGKVCASAGNSLKHMTAPPGMTTKAWFFTFCLVAVLYTLFSYHVYAASPDSDTADSGIYIQSHDEVESTNIIDPTASQEDESPPSWGTETPEELPEIPEQDATLEELPEVGATQEDVHQQAEPPTIIKKETPFVDYGIAEIWDPRYTNEEQVLLAAEHGSPYAQALLDEWAGEGITLGSSGLTLGVSGLDDSGEKSPDTELSVLQEIRDTLNIFYILAVFGISYLIVKFIIRCGLSTFTHYTGF